MFTFKSFEFDPFKNAANSAKHGIDFNTAQRLWEDAYVENPLPYAMERRFMVTGLIDKKFWSATITYRHEVIRIISVRRARPQEIARWHIHHP